MCIVTVGGRWNSCHILLPGPLPPPALSRLSATAAFLFTPWAGVPADLPDVGRCIACPRLICYLADLPEANMVFGRTHNTSPVCSVTCRGPAVYVRPPWARDSEGVEVRLGGSGTACRLTLPADRAAAVAAGRDACRRGKFTPNLEVALESKSLSGTLATSAPALLHPPEYFHVVGHWLVACTCSHSRVDRTVCPHHGQWLSLLLWLLWPFSRCRVSPAVCSSC